MDSPFASRSTLVSIIAHDKAIRSCRVQSLNINLAITLGTVTVLQIGCVKVSMSGVNRRWLQPAGKRAINIGVCTDPGGLTR